MELEKILYNLLIDKNVAKAIEQIEEHYEFYKKEEAIDIMAERQQKIYEAGEYLRWQIKNHEVPTLCYNCKSPNLTVDVQHTHEVYGLKEINGPIPYAPIETPGGPNSKLVAYDKVIKVRCSDCEIEYGTSFKMVIGKDGTAEMMG